MGNDISSISSFESNIRKYGEWEYGKKCCDDPLRKKVKKIIWRSSPLTKDILLELTNFLKTKIYGMTSSNTFQDLTHDFIEVYFECENEECKMKEEKYFCETFEYSPSGLSREVGKYRKIYKEVNSFIPKNIDYLTLFYLKFKMENTFKASDYNFLLFNCKTFANRFYSTLLESEKSGKELNKMLAGTCMDPKKMTDKPEEKELLENNFLSMFLILNECGLLSKNK